MAKAEIKDEISGEIEKLQLEYFKSIPTTDKIYHKVQVPGNIRILNNKDAFARYMDQNFDETAAAFPETESLDADTLPDPSGTTNKLS